MKEEKKIFKNWYVWVIVFLAVLCVLLFIALQIKNEVVTTNNNIPPQIQQISNNSMLYISNDSLILYVEHFEEVDEEIDNTIKYIRDNKNTTFKNYNKLITISLLDDEENSNNEYMILKQEIDLSNFEIISNKTYIDFENYKTLYDTYEDTMTKYKDLYNSIY